MPPTYTEGEARRAVATSRSFAEALRRLGRCPTGGAGPVLRKWVVLWDIPTDHFDSGAARSEALRRAARGPTPLDEILVEHSTYSRGHLKERLFAEGLKNHECEMCGQGELWKGRRMALILDHVNGVADDNRLPNLRIVCPNCAATLETHCGRKLRLESRSCLRCGTEFTPRYGTNRYCSRKCGQRWDRSSLRGPRPDRRKVERPPYTQLRKEVLEAGYLATGRKYGVSDNAVRKWIRAYEWDMAKAAGRLDGQAGPI